MLNRLFCSAYCLFIMVVVMLPVFSASAQNLQRFTVVVGNKIVDNTVGYSMVMAQGLWVVHDQPDVLFSEGRVVFRNGFEALAEDGDARPAFKALQNAVGVVDVGLFPQELLLPGQEISFAVEALPGHRLSLAIMLIESNDKFFAPTSQGIALFDRRGQPVRGNLSDTWLLWDAGTEQDEEPALGIYQPLRQQELNSGSAQNARIYRLPNPGQGISFDGFFYPRPRDVLSLIITPDPSP